MKQTLTKGDIIIFKAENDWLSKAIAWFTQSDVCHAAMAYSEDSIVEVGASGIGVHKVDISDGDNIYVMRLVSEPNPEPLIASADAYINAKVRYDFPKLFILAGAIIYRRIVPTTDVLHISNEILTVCTFMLDEMIQHALLHHTDQAMVCSELVYRIFYDCGREYQIQIVDGCLWNSPITEDIVDSIRLYDYLPAKNITAGSSTDDLTLPEKDYLAAFPTLEETEDLAERLYTALCQSEIKLQENQNIRKEAVAPTLSKAEKFLSKLQYFMELVKCDLPVEAMFITPGDLVYHSKNLKKQGSLYLKRL